MTELELLASMPYEHPKHVPPEDANIRKVRSLVRAGLLQKCPGQHVYRQTEAGAEVAAKWVPFCASLEGK